MPCCLPLSVSHPTHLNQPQLKHGDMQTINHEHSECHTRPTTLTIMQMSAASFSMSLRCCPVAISLLPVALPQPCSSQQEAAAVVSSSSRARHGRRRGRSSSRQQEGQQRRDRCVICPAPVCCCCGPNGCFCCSLSPRAAGWGSNGVMHVFDVETCPGCFVVWCCQYVVALTSCHIHGCCSCTASYRCYA